MLRKRDTFPMHDLVSWPASLLAHVVTAHNEIITTAKSLYV